MDSNVNARSVLPREARSDGLSLIFKPGQRPAADDVLRFSDSRTTGIAVRARSPSAAGQLELATAGMIFDLAGLAPAQAAPTPQIVHWYGFRERPAEEPVEAVTLTPADGFGADDRLSQVRVMVGLAARLAGLANVTAVVWHAARCAMPAQAFATAIDNWLQGGAFPALGLTALFPDANGAIRSEGLAFFTGQELLVERDTGTSTAMNVKIAARLINELVGSEAIHERIEFIGPNGEQLSVEPLGSDRFLRVCRKF